MTMKNPGLSMAQPSGALKSSRREQCLLERSLCNLGVQGGLGYRAKPLEQNVVVHDGADLLPRTRHDEDAEPVKHER